MSTPGVVIDGQVVHDGGVPSRQKVEEWLSSARRPERRRLNEVPTTIRIVAPDEVYAITAFVLHRRATFGLP